MKFDVYGKFQLEIVREEGNWRAFRIGSGLRIPLHDLMIPSHLRPMELPAFLDDVFHEKSAPGDEIRKI